MTEHSDDAEPSDFDPRTEAPTSYEAVVEETPGVRRRRLPIATIVLIVANVLMAVVDRVQPAVEVRFMFVPPLADAEPYRFITSAFLHSGFWHLVFNMYALWLVGSVLEPAIGKARFLALYFVSAVAGNVAFLLAAQASNNWNTAVVGASGAVFGLFGALFVIAKWANMQTASILGVLGINAVLGFMLPGIAWESHLGGLLAGALLAWLFTVTARKPKSTRRLLDIGSAILVSAAVVAIRFLA